MTNEVIERLPPHLHQYIKPQNYAHYSAIDQAVWRYVMQKNMAFLSTYAHPTYINGLAKVGISKDQIPNMYGMNRILKDIGWAAVTVDGFIPPRAFMEFQAYNVLVIASEMRQLKHIEYTPAPDIIHEAAGHAPLLADPEYASFLRRFGEIGAKAISSPHNKKLYRAIRELSILKELPGSSKIELERAEAAVHDLQKQKVKASEMDQLRNLHWWSVEYGLIGSPKDFLLYGAGLLSSIGESKWCMSKQVKKLPFTQEVIHQNFDITQPQPQLFVTPNFAHLSKILEKVANSMGLRKGGKKSVDKLVASEEVGTVELSTGLQISGTFKRCIPHPLEHSKAAYIQTTGLTALSFRNQELVGHGTSYHSDGFGSPLGKLKDSNLPIEDMTPSDLEAFSLIEGQTTSLCFESGVVVKGKVITGMRSIFGKIMLISFANCTVTFQNEILFQPSWGKFDMAIGASIRSAYAGPADLQYFPFEKNRLYATPEISFPPENVYYQALEVQRSSPEKATCSLEDLGKEILQFEAEHWLLIVEFYTLCMKKKNVDWTTKAKNRLKEIKQQNASLAACIKDGLTLIKH
jgi:phenylalanine-4-hydroxylase